MPDDAPEHGPDREPGSAWIDPEWALLASAQVERERLADTATGKPGGTSAGILDRTRPVDLDAPALVDGIVGLQRLVNWAQAVQQRYIAELTRPGIALPLDELIEVASSPLGMARDLPDDVSSRALRDDPA